MKWIAGTTTDTQLRVKWNKWFSSLRQQFTRTRLPLNAIPLACTASIGYFSPTHFTLLALSSCCFPQISVLLEVGNPPKSFYPIRGRLMQMSRNNILAPRLLRKLHWFKTHYPKSRVTNSDNTLLLLVSESKTILTLPLGEETIILWMSLDGIARSSRFADNYWLPLIDPFSTDRTSDTKSKEREIRRSKFETYENLHVHVTSPNRDKRRTALRFVISLPFPREKCNARSLFKERERERSKKTAAKSSKRYNVPYVKCCPSIAALWIFHLCGTSFTLHPGTERQLNSSCILATALLWGNGSRGTGGRVWSGYCWKRTAVFVFPSSPNKASFSRSLLAEKRNSRRTCTVSFVSRSFWPRPLLLVPCWLLFW